MARIRSDKPEAYQSETLAEISLAAERTFKGMATIADDRGRLADKPAQINGELWSMRGSHTRDDLEAELGEMVKVDLVCRYAGCDGKRYLHLVRWDQHQKIDRPSKSRLPRCPHHQPDPDYCGRHEGDCQPVEVPQGFDAPSRESREGSRDSQPPQSGLDANADTDERVLQGDVIPPSANGVQAHSNTPSDQGEQESSRESREPSMLDLGSRTVDRGSRIVDPSLPATPDADKPRRRSKAEDPERAKNAGDVVAAFMDGAQSSGQPEPATSIRARVGRDARTLLAEGYDVETLIKSAYRMGMGEWNDLAVQVRKDAAGSGPGSPAPPRPSSTDRAMAEAQALKAKLAARRQEQS